MKYSLLVALYEQLSGTTKRLEKTYHIAEFLKDTGERDIRDVGYLLQGKIFPDYDDRKIGVASKLVLKSIALAAGVSVERVEKEWRKTGDLGLCASSLIHGKKQQTLSSQSLTVAKVIANL